jgi:hypothetical protein
VHILPALGSIPLQKLEPAQLQAFYSRKLEGGRGDGKAGGLSARTVRYLDAILREVLQHAIKMQLLARNVAEATEPPRAVRPQVPSWDIDEVQRFLPLTNIHRWIRSDLARGADDRHAPGRTPRAVLARC